MKAGYLLLAVCLAPCAELLAAPRSIFKTSTSVAATNTAYDGHEIVVNGCTLTINGRHLFANLVLTNNAILTHSPVSSDLTNNRIDLLILGDLTVAKSCRIDANGLGYEAANGPGAGTNAVFSWESGGSGAGHGGNGGVGYSSTPIGGAAYDSFLSPDHPGSGGGAKLPSYPGYPGGGVVRLTVLGTLTVNGSLSADGSGGSKSFADGGGGAGGSVHLVVGTLAGTGSVTANGGGKSSNSYGGGGGGGRIAVDFATNTFVGTMTAWGGSGYYTGGAGTVFTCATSSVVGDLRMDNAGAAGSFGTFTPMTSPVPFNLTVANFGLVEAVGDLTLMSLEVKSRSKLRHTPGQSNLCLFVRGDVAIEPDAQISVDGWGYGASEGPGAGADSSAGASGGGHGGRGGMSWGFPQLPGGSTYDSLFAPVERGSGGGEGSSSYTGGYGGGAIRMVVGGNLRVDGRLSANGWESGGHGGGGGAGGSLYLTASSFQGTGTINALGGMTWDNGGAGGGGRIAVYSLVLGDITNRVSVRGGTNKYSYIGTPGTNGTVFYSNAVPPLVVSHNASVNASGLVDHIDVAFNQQINPSTFKPDDVVVSTPTGAVSTAQLTVAHLSNSVWRVVFPPLALGGKYTIQLGPQIENSSGQAMPAVYRIRDKPHAPRVIFAGTAKLVRSKTVESAVGARVGFIELFDRAFHPKPSIPKKSGQSNGCSTRQRPPVVGSNTG